MPETKSCRRCGKIKSTDDFRPHHCTCKECTRIQAIEREKNHPHKYREQYMKKSWKKMGINITIERYTELFREQEGRCAICGEFQANLGTWLCVDHNHKTGQIRSLLCANCNRVLGSIKENSELMKKMIKYLDLWTCEERS